MEVPPPGVSQNEFKELRRVFNFLSDFAAKQRLQRELGPKRERRDQVIQSQSPDGSVRVVDERGHDIPAHVLASEVARLSAEIALLQRKLDHLQSNSLEEKRIHARDLQLALQFLGKQADKREVEEMVWEVDENLDGAVDWEELLLMFRRNIADKTGLEPCRVFNVVQFCMYDRDFTGRVSIDETMHMLYARYGKERLEAEMRQLFGERLGGYTEGSGSLTFCDYLSTIGNKSTATAAGNAGGDSLAAAAT